MVTRRTMLAVATCTAAGAVAPVAAATPALAAARQAAVPRTLSARRLVRNGRLYVAQTEFRLSHLGLAWRGPAAQVRTRTASGWSRWRTVEGCPGGRDGWAHAGGDAVLVATGAVGYEVWVAGEGTAQVTELNTVGGAASTLAPASSMPLPGGSACAVPYLSRAAWGADESKMDWAPEYFPVQTLTVHHSATMNGDPDPAATVRAIYNNQAVNLQWGDIGYQLFIDEAGRVYEGRSSGSDPMPVFDAQPAASGRHNMTTGAHVEGFNSGNIGICLLGDFTSRLPTAAARESLSRVLAALANVSGLDPRGTTNYVNPVTGAAKTVKTICGHRDWAATLCPGDTFYPQLPALRKDVYRRLLKPRRATSPRTGGSVPPRRI